MVNIEKATKALQDYMNTYDKQYGFIKSIQKSVLLMIYYMD